MAEKWSGLFAPPKSKAIANSGEAFGRAAYARSLHSWAPGAWTDNRLEQSRHLVGAVYVAIKVLADQAASAELSVYKRKDQSRAGSEQDTRTPLDFDHPIVRLLKRPNNKETGGMWRRKVIQQLALTGSSLSWRLDSELRTKKNLYQPAELWAIPTATWQPAPRGPAYPEGAYRVAPYFAAGPLAQLPGLVGAGGVVVPADEVVSIAFPNPIVTYDAYSPLTACALQLDALEAIDQARWYTMQSGCNPSATVELDGAVSGMLDQPELDRLKEEFSAKYAGVKNAGRIAVLSPGAKLVPYSHAPGDMGWEQSWSQLVDFVLSVFGTTKSLAFMSEASSYAALYAALKQFNLFSLTPLLDLITDSLNVQLVWRFWGEEYFCELTPKKIDDESLQESRARVLISCGAATNNEIRHSLDYEPVKDKWGEERATQGGGQPQPGGMGGPGGEEGTPGQGPPGQESPEQAAGRESPGEEQSGGSLPPRIAERLASMGNRAEGKGAAWRPRDGQKGVNGWANH